MKRVFLTSIALVALTSSAALAQSTASSHSGSGPNAGSSSVHSPSQTSSSAELINTAGTILDIDLANSNTMPLMPSMVADGFIGDRPEQFLGVLSDFGNEFGDDASTFCNFSIEAAPNNCSTGH